MTTKTGISPIFLPAESLADRVSHAVRRGILEGRLRPGENLSISDLATDLGVSHSPVREALQRLSSQGLIVLRPARSAMVAPLGLADLQEIYRLRRLIEVEAVARAAPLLSDGDLTTLDVEFAKLCDVPPDDDAFWAGHNAFHAALLAPVTTPRLERIVTELWHAGERYIRIVYIETDVLFTHSADDRHRPLLHAAHTRNATAMRNAIAHHLLSNEREIVKSLKAVVLGRSDDGAEPASGPRSPRPA